MKSVYIETSIPSYLTARPSRDVRAAAWQELTVRVTMYHDEIIEEVWKNREALAKRYHHNLYEIVLDLQQRQKTPLTELVDRRRRASGPMVCREARQP